MAWSVRNLESQIDLPNGRDARAFTRLFYLNGGAVVDTNSEQNEIPWWQDLHVDVVAELLEDALVTSMVAETDFPHIVVCTSGNGVSYSGPYPSGFAAMHAAEDERKIIGDDPLIRVAVAPLGPPVDA